MDDMEMLMESLGLDDQGLSAQLMDISTVFTLGVAAVFGFLILLVYLKTSGRETRDRNLFMVIPVLTLLMAVIMRIQGAQVVLFFGIFGILSIVRFRSDLTDQKGITFILFSVIAGVLVGVNQYVLASLAFVVVSGTIFIARFAFPHRVHFRMILKTDGDPVRLRELAERWLDSGSTAYRYISFSSEQAVSSKTLEWQAKSKIEYEISLPEEGDLMVRWLEFLPLVKEAGAEAEIKPGPSD